MTQIEAYKIIIKDYINFSNKVFQKSNDQNLIVFFYCFIIDILLESNINIKDLSETFNNFLKPFLYESIKILKDQLKKEK